MSYPNPGDNPYGEVTGTSSSTWTQYSGVFVQLDTSSSTWFHMTKNTATAGTMLFDSVIISGYFPTEYIDDISVSNLTIDGNRDNQTGTSIRHGLGFRYVNGVSVSNVTIKKVGNLAAGAAYGKGVYVANSNNVRIDGNYFYGCISSIDVTEQSGETPAIVLPDDAVEDIQIVNNYVDQLYPTYDGTDGISVQLTRAAIISNNVVKNIHPTFLAIWMNAVDTGNAKKGIISNNAIYAGGVAAIAAENDAADPAALYWLINGNHIDTATYGITAFGKSVISNNVILNIGATGIATGGGDNLLIADNYIDHEKGVAGSGILAFYSGGITINNISIIGNIVRNMTTRSIGITTSAAAGTVIDGVVVSNNNMDGDLLVQNYDATPFGVRYAAVVGNVYKTWNAGNVVDTVNGCVVQHNVDLP